MSIWEKILNVGKSAAGLVNVKGSAKDALTQIRDDFKRTFKVNKMDLDIGRIPGTQIIVVELNHVGVQAQVPFAQNVAELAHHYGLGNLEEGDEAGLGGSTSVKEMGNAIGQIASPPTTQNPSNPG